MEEDRLVSLGFCKEEIVKEIVAPDGSGEEKAVPLVEIRKPPFGREVIEQVAGVVEGRVLQVVEVG